VPRAPRSLPAADVPCLLSRVTEQCFQII
jgi:hypothetical protein